MAWLSLHIWMLLAAAALLGLLFGSAVRGLMLRGRLRRAEVERDMSALELEQAKTEIEALYAAQRKAGAPDEALQQQLREREEAVQRLGEELKSAKAELQQLSDGGRNIAMTGGAAIAGAAVGAVAGHAGSADDGENSQEQLEWRNRYLESRVRRLEDDLRKSAAPAGPEVPEEGAVQTDAAPAGSELEKLRWQNKYMRQRLSVFEDKAAQAKDASSAGANAPSQQETPDEELARLRWRNRYLEGRLAYLEEEQASDDNAAGVTTAAAVGAVSAAGGAVVSELVSQSEDDSAPVEDEQGAQISPDTSTVPEPISASAPSTLVPEEEASSDPSHAAAPEPVTELTPTSVPAEEETSTEPFAPPSGDAAFPGDGNEPVADQSGEAASDEQGHSEPAGSGTGAAELEPEQAGETAAHEEIPPVEPAASSVEDASSQHPADQLLRDLDAQDNQISEETGASDNESPAEGPPTLPEAGSEAEPAVSEVEPVRPEGLASRPKDGGDDLTAIDGIGPRLQEVLNSLGIWHFQQIANWNEANASWIDQELNFSGRVARQDWVGQAQRLCAGT